MLADASNYLTTRPQLMLWPGIAIILTTLAFNLLGDGLRDAVRPPRHPALARGRRGPP